MLCPPLLRARSPNGTLSLDLGAATNSFLTECLLAEFLLADYLLALLIIGLTLFSSWYEVMGVFPDLRVLMFIALPSEWSKVDWAIS